MKTTACVLLLSFAVLPLFAEQELKNPDFVDGRSHWEGDGESASVAANADAIPTLDANNTVPTGGLLLKLSRQDWTRVTQNFRPLGSNGVLTIVYKLSDGLTFSTERKDYSNVPALMGFGGYKPFSIKPGNWIALFIESTTSMMEYYNITPKAGSATQTYIGHITGLAQREDKTLCLSFPPGSGTVTITHVGLETQ
jgi:hypothetical protein